MPSRRIVLASGAAIAVAGTAALAACSSGGRSTSPPSAPAPSAPGEVLAQLNRVPTGSAVAVNLSNGQPAIVARPDENTAVAFSAICTHQGCTVNPTGAELRCPCHGSVFNSFNGSVKHGPANAPLHRIPVQVEGGNIVSTA